MQKIIKYENLRNFTYSNDKLISTDIKGIVLSFFGLGATGMLSEDSTLAQKLAAEGIIYLVPYNNPWAWMNKQAVAYTDELIDVLMEHYSLPENLPIVSTGGSMGGLSALVYTAKSKRTPVACVANCPVCDLPYHFTERPDLPRTLYSAFYHESCTLEQAMEASSPFHLENSMPDVKYYIFHCDSDSKVNKGMHSDRFVERFKDKLDITYHIVEGRDHCDLTDEMKALYEQYMFDSILK